MRRKSVSELSIPSKRTRESLEPFWTVFTRVLATEARRSNPLELVPDEVLRIARTLEMELMQAAGRRFHPALAVYGFRLCCCCSTRSARKPSSNRMHEQQQQTIDAIWALIFKLEEHYGILELNLVIG